MRRHVLVGLALVLMPFAGCADASVSSTDCNAEVRRDGVVYTAWSSTAKEARRLGEAERASCDDSGLDARGSYFSEQSEHVAVWSFDGYSSDEVLGVKLDKTSYTIFVADSLSADDRNRIIETLGDAE